MQKMSDILTAQLPSDAEAVQEKVFVTYTFTDQEDRQLPITLLESRYVIASSGTTGLRTWEAALHLCNYLCRPEGRRYAENKNILELGAGTAAVSIFCAKHLGASHVMATDGNELVVDAIKSNIFVNGLDSKGNIEAAALKWGRTYLNDVSVEEDYADGSLDVILAADVVSCNFAEHL
jgi:protein-lysine N-methyltransferase EEF2KMT